VPPRRPRLFALDLDDARGRAAAVQAAVSLALSDGGFHEPERRPFWPHVTFARVARGTGGTGSGARLPVPAVELAPPPEPFSASAVTLYRSHLSPRGSSYEPLARVRLRRG
jgi:2'-5' RNA ligase